MPWRWNFRMQGEKRLFYMMRRKKTTVLKDNVRTKNVWTVSGAKRIFGIRVWQR